MRIIALVGKSGTGKSHKAHWVARENELDFIIDDGLLIQGSTVLAGHSAKRERTLISAIRRAIFQDPAHAAKVRNKIEEKEIDNILLLGTSETMINAICKALSLPPPERIIAIEDISTDKELDTARRIRTVDGKHVIPVPTLEIKKSFSGYLLDPLKIFYRRGKYADKIVDEKSVVRPTYSYMGKYTIYDTLVSQIALYTARQVPGIGSGGKANIIYHTDGIEIMLELVVEYGLSLVPILVRVQKEVAAMVEHMTALNVMKVNVTAKKFVFR